MDAERKFKDGVNYYLDNEDKCEGIIFPSKFELNTRPCNSIITKSGNIGVVKLEQIYRDFVNVSVNLWNMFNREDSIYVYRMIAYINTRIKFNTNVVRITKDMFDGFICKESNKRGYITAINKLLDYSVISRNTAYRDQFVVNPLYIFKGNIYTYKELCDKYQMLATTTDSKGRIIPDKVLIIKDIKEKEVELIINKKYIKPNKVKKEEKIKELPKLKLKMV